MRILVIQLRRLGDLILTSPVIAAIGKHQPQAQIVLAVTPECEPLLPALSGIQQTIITRRGLRDIGAWVKLRRHCFDCTIDLTRNDRSAWLTFLSGARQRIVSDRVRHQSRLRARCYTEFVRCTMKEMHIIDYYLALLQPLGIVGATTELTLDLPATARANAATIIRDRIEHEPFAIFHPGSAREDKFWETDRWATAIKFTSQELGLCPVLSGGNNATERRHFAAIGKRLEVPVVDLSGQLDLLTLAALIEKARLLVTVDSAPVHLASASKTPQVILFGPTNPFHWRPRNSPVAILFGNSPQPLRNFQYQEGKRPMNEISTAAVIDAIGSMLSAPAASAV